MIICAWESGEPCSGVQTLPVSPGTWTITDYIDCTVEYAEHKYGTNLYTCDQPLFEDEYQCSEMLCCGNGLGVVDYLPMHKSDTRLPAIYWQLRDKVASVPATSHSKNSWNHLRLPLSIIIIIISVFKNKTVLVGIHQGSAVVGWSPLLCLSWGLMR